MVALAEKFSRETYTPRNRTARNSCRPKNAYRDPFQQSGNQANNNPFRFSSKYLDDSLGWYYYGYRYYSPELGRWLNRDPVGERGGMNLYGFAANTPIGTVDFIGLAPVCPLPPLSKDPCPKCCSHCEARGDMRIRDNGTSGKTIRLKVDRSYVWPKLYSVFVDGTKVEGGPCCGRLRVYKWENCYLKNECHIGDTYEESFVPTWPIKSKKDYNTWAIRLNAEAVVDSCRKGKWIYGPMVGSNNNIYQYFIGIKWKLIWGYGGGGSPSPLPPGGGSPSLPSLPSLPTL
jgi:RHS repeat-associated protein